jgi:hypothetical protein
MTEYLHPGQRDVDFPDRLPEDLQTIVWRYIDDWKFIDLIKQHGLYLCRGDKLQDTFEGTYSRYQIMDQDRWLGEIGYANLIPQEKKQREENRRNFYVSSWCMYNHDLDLVWKAYTKVCHAVAVQSRVAKLVAICDKAIEHRPLNVSIVKYFGHKEGDFINYFATGFDAFVHKDYHFKLDNEIRIVYMANWAKNQGQTPEGIVLPVELSVLIERVVLAPGSTSKDAEAIRNLLNEYGLENITVESSRYEKGLME